MIKYLEYDSYDEYGQHIIPVNDLYQMNKTASGTYSPELMKVILTMKRRDDRYYVVINAMGSEEFWGSNKNGDSFPVAGLAHKSYRTDMGSINDYGYKTFEYYAYFYKHHVNKDPKKSFGEVIFSHWNEATNRVELIVALNTTTAANTITKLEAGEPVSVSMGAKVKHDRCSICDNKATTRKKYCKHLTKYMNHIVTEDLARTWSRETGRIIKPGTQVCAKNDKPRFFDISEVYVGAERTAFVLGKAASHGPVTLSADIAEAYGVTDEDFDKVSQVTKESEIEKEVGGNLGPNDIDGKVIKADSTDVIRKALNERMHKTISEEPMLPKNLLDSSTALPLKNILSTMLGMGIVPKPGEFQRIVIIKAGERDLADKLDDAGEVFNYRDNSNPISCPLSNDYYADALGKALLPHLEKRSCFTPLLKLRLDDGMTKAAFYSSTTGNDYWSQPSSEDSTKSVISPTMATIGGLAALYAGFKLKALGYGPKQLSEIFVNKPWLRALIGGGVLWKLQDSMSKSKLDPALLRPASDYEGVLQDTNFSGHIKTSGLADALILPNAYIVNAINQGSYKRQSPSRFNTDSGISKISSFNGNKDSILTKNEAERINKRIFNLL